MTRLTDAELTELELDCGDLLHSSFVPLALVRRALAEIREYRSLAGRIGPSAEQLAQWRASADAATPGPWRWSETFLWNEAEDVGVLTHGEAVDWLVRPGDAAFIAASRHVVPALCDRVEEMETALAVTANSRDSNHRARLAAERERDAYRAVLCDLVAAQRKRGTTAEVDLWDRARDLIKNGVTP